MPPPPERGAYPTGAATPSAAELLDVGQLAALLREIPGPVLLGALAQIDAEVAALTRAVATAQTDAAERTPAARAAHALAGSAATLGIASVSDCARTIMTALEVGDLDRAGRVAAGLAGVHDRAVAAFRTFIEEAPACGP